MIGALLAGFLAAADPSTAASVDRAHLEEIYQRPQFARARLRNQGTLEQLWKQLVAWFDSFFESRGAATYSSITRFLVLLAAFAVAGWAVLRLLSRRRPRPAAPPGPADPAALQLDDPATHLRRARGTLSTDPRAALREGLLALLSTLERRRLARPDRVKTNRELARELPGRGATPELSQAVERLLGGYDRTFYSLQPVAEADAARFLDEVERLG